MANGITMTFLGHAAWQIRHGAHDILIDPFITNNPKATVDPDDLNPTHIILTHGHGDHLGDTVEIARRCDALVIGAAEVQDYVEAKGCRGWGMNIGGARDFEFGRLKFTIAHHSSAGPDGIDLGNPMGALLMLGGRTIFHAGDTGLFLDMELIGRRHPIDVALLPIGDNFTMGVDDGIAAVEMLRPKVAIPMHYNTFPLIEVDPEQFRVGVEKLGVEARILQPGESYTLETEG